MPSLDMINQLMTQINPDRRSIMGNVRIQTRELPNFNFGISTNALNSNTLDFINDGFASDGRLTINDMMTFQNHRERIGMNERQMMISSSENNNDDDNESISSSSSSSLDGSRFGNFRRNLRNNNNFSSSNEMQQFFQIDNFTNLRMNPMNLNDPHNSVNSIFRTRNNFMNFQSIWDRNRISHSESDSDEFIRNEENFELLNDDEYSSASDQNDDPIGVNMNEIMLEQEEEDEPIDNDFHQMENNNFNNDNEEERSYYSNNDFDNDPLNQPIQDVPDIDPNEEQNIQETNFDSRIEMRNIERVPNYLHNSQNNIIIEGIEEEEIHQDNEREEDQLMEDEGQEDSGYDDSDMNDYSDSFYDMDQSDISNDFDESERDYDHNSNSSIRLSTNMNQIELENNEFHQENIIEEENNPDSGAESLNENDFIQEIEYQNRIIKEEIENELNIHKIFLKENNSNVIEEEEDTSNKFKDFNSLPEIHLDDSNLDDFTKLKEKSCILILNKLLSPLTQINYIAHLKTNKNFGPKAKFKPITKKNLFKFDVCSDIWSDLYSDILSQECKLKYTNYPFKFPRSLSHDVVQIQGDFASKYFTILLQQQAYNGKSYWNSNTPIILKKSGGKSSNHRQIRMIYQDIKNLGFNLIPDNVSYKKNFEQLAMVGSCDWDGKKLTNNMEKDHFRVVVLRKAIDLYNYPSQNKCGQQLGKKHFKFNKEMYWTSDNTKDSSFQKLSMLNFNTFPIYSFNYISQLSDFVRNCSKKYESHLFKIKSSAWDSKLPSSNNMSIYEVSKEDKSFNSNNFIYNHIEKKDFWYNKLKVKEDFSKEIMVESKVFNDVFEEILDNINMNLDQMKNHKKGEDIVDDLGMLKVLFGGEFRKISQDKLEIIHKKFIDFCIDNSFYMDFAEIDIKGKFSFLVVDNEPFKLDQSKDVAIDKPFSINKELVMKKFISNSEKISEEDGNNRLINLEPQANSFETPRQILDNIFQIDLNPTERNQEPRDSNQRSQLDDQQLRLRSVVNMGNPESPRQENNLDLPSVLTRQSRRVLGLSSLNINSNNNQNNIDQPIPPIQPIDNIRPMIPLQPITPLEPLMPIESIFNVEPVIATEPTIPPNLADNNEEENQQNIENNIEEGPNQVQNNENFLNPILNENNDPIEETNVAAPEIRTINFEEIGLPSDILTRFGFTTDVFNSFPPDIQITILESYAQDLNIEFDRQRVEQMLIPPQNQINNNAPLANQNVVAAENLNNPNQIEEENQEEVVNPNQIEEENQEQLNPNQIEEENQEEVVNPNQIEEENQEQLNPNQIEQEQADQNELNVPPVDAPSIAIARPEARHFLYDLDISLRRSILAEMPAAEINLLPQDLQQEARNLQNTTNNNNNNNNNINPNDEIIINLNTAFIRNDTNRIQFEGQNLSPTLQRMIFRSDPPTRPQVNSSEQDSEYEKIEMEYNGVNKVKKIINDNLAMLDKVKKGNHERNMYLKLHETNNFQNVKPVDKDFKKMLFDSVGYLNCGGIIRAVFGYIIKDEMYQEFNENILTLIQNFINFLERKYLRDNTKEDYYEIQPREKFYLKNMLSMIMECTKTHNIYFVRNPKSLSIIFQNLKKISLIKDDIIIQRILPLPLQLIKSLIKTKQVDKKDLFFKQKESFFLQFKISHLEIRTVLSVISPNLKFYNQREIIIHCFIQIEYLLLNPENWNTVIEAVSDFLNKFCEKINSNFEDIKELTFDKSFRDRNVNEPKSKNKKKMILEPKKINETIELQLKDKIDQLQLLIQNLQRIFERVEMLFVKIIKYCFQNKKVNESVTNYLVQECITYLEKKLSNQKNIQFIKYKEFMINFQKKFIDEEMQEYYLKFAQILKKNNLNFMFKNLFLVFKIFEENFEHFVTKKTRMSQPIFYKLEPLLETFLIFYKMICNEEVVDYFKQNFTKLILDQKKDFRTLYLKYKGLVIKANSEVDQQKLLDKCVEQKLESLKNEILNKSEDQGVSFDESNDIDLFKKKNIEIKASEYQLNFNHPQNKIQSEFNHNNDIQKMKQKFEGGKNLNESESSHHILVNEYSNDKNDMSYLMAKGESNSFLMKLEDKKIKRGQKLSELKDKFEKLFRTGVKMNKKIINHFIESKQKIWTSSFHIIVKNLHQLINFKNKRKYFKQFISSINNKKIQKITITRDNLLYSSFNQIQHRKREFFRGKWVITFAGEEGEDAGGVSREFFLKLSKEILTPDYNFFIPASHGYAFHPSPTYKISGVDPQIYEFVGKIVGKALFEGYFLDAHFTRAFYKQMIQFPLNFNDFEDYDPEYYKNLKWVIENDPQVLGLTFSVEEDNFGKIQAFELKPNGINIEVTNENKMEYVDLLIKHKLSDRVKTQVERFLKGLNDVIPRNLLKIFNPKEIELLISGLPEISITDLQKHTEYTGYHKDSNIIKWFWKILRSFDTNLKAGFLQFVTGTSKVPLEGFEFLKGMGGNVQKFQIHRSYNVQNLPTSHTCMNQLDLPEYPSEDELREKLVKAIEFGKEGFGFV